MHSLKKRHVLKCVLSVLVGMILPLLMFGETRAQEPLFRSSRTKDMHILKKWRGLCQI